MSPDEPRGNVSVNPGDTIADKYIVTGVIASGGMGMVVAARDRQLQRMVAIKLLREGMAAREGTLARFEREGRVVARLTGEHIAKVFDFGRLKSGEPFIVMELLDGETLGDRIRAHAKLRPEEAVHFLLQTCEGLAEAHGAGIIHRDLKPDNLFIARRVDQTESIKIIDFGISKVQEGLGQVTIGSDMIGTPAYMAPEQLDAPGGVDERADIWSLGAVLYKALSGEVPFAVEGVLQIVSAIAQSEPRPLRDHVPDLPEGLAAVVHKCLTKDREKRYGSVVELAKALAPFARDEGEAGESLDRLERIAKNRIVPSQRKGRGTPDLTPTAAGPAVTEIPSPASSASASTKASATTSRRNVLLAGGVTTAGLAVTAGLRAWRGPPGDASAASASRPEASASAPPAGSAASAPSGTPIKIGVLHSLTGTMASSESSLVDAILLAIARINASGGLLGRPVDAITRDGRSQADTFALEAQHLLDVDKVPVVFGCWTSTSRRAVRHLFEEREKPLFYSVQYEGIEASPAVIYLGAAPNQQLIPAVRWAFAFLQRKKFFLVGSDYVFPRVATEILKDQLKELGATVAGEAFLPLGTVHVDAVIRELKASGATMILNTINGDTNLAFLRALRAAGITSQQIPTLSFSLDRTGYRELDPAIVASDYLAWNYFEAFDSPANHDFLRALHDRFGPRPATDPMATSYSAVLLWAEAVRKAGSLELAAIRKALETVSVSTPLGELHITPSNGHAVKTVAIGQIGDDGSIQVVWSAPKPVEATPYPETRTHEEWEKLLAKLQKEWNGKWQAPAAP
jgi:urea transport system substrate-binding protein